MSVLALLGGKPALDSPPRLFSSIGDAEREAVERVLKDGELSGFLGAPSERFFGGPEVRGLEDDWCERFGVGNAVSVNSATSGLIAAMGAIGIQPGDQVIVPPYTMSATAVAPMIYGGRTVFADIEAEHFCLSCEAVANAITEKTKAIVTVNLFGHPSELEKLRALADERGVFLIEDNAQAVLSHENARLCGTVADIGVFSLNVHKHLQCGEGGVCVTNDRELADRLRLIRNHGENAMEWLNAADAPNLAGYNFRLPELSAAIARAQLAKAEELVSRCEDIGSYLSNGIQGVTGLEAPAVREGCRHVYFMWSAKFDEGARGISRASFCEALRAENVPVAEGYVEPLYHLPVFKSSGNPEKNPDAESFPVVEHMYEHSLFQIQIVALDLNPAQQKAIVGAVEKVVDCIPDLRSAAGTIETG